MTSESSEFATLRRVFEQLTPGQKAELRRVGEPEELRDYATLYRLFPGQNIHSGHLRLAFLLPWCEQVDAPASLGRQCVEARINEARLLQVARSTSPNDIKQFRRLAIQIKPKVNWAEFWQTLWYWGPKAKHDLVEQFYLAKFAKSEFAKGGNK